MSRTTAIQGRAAWRADSEWQPAFLYLDPPSLEEPEPEREPVREEAERGVVVIDIL
jgi:hypothetical protein